ncbi:MAG: hypothetical protein E7311_05085 [Clostridiales bacterium]|nr:hypothetical protein [Clostridiales bacterium]
MKIGIDIDGVILDYEAKLRVYAEMYDVLELKGKGIINKNSDLFQEAYGWSDEQNKYFMDNYFEKLSQDIPVLPGAKEVIYYLKKCGHELVIISARGTSLPNMINLAKNILDKNEFVFDKYIWKQKDKLKACVEEKVDYMIDDNSTTCERLSNNKIKTIYFKSVATRDLEKNEYLKQVTNWGEIYRFFKEMEKENE